MTLRAEDRQAFQDQASLAAFSTGALFHERWTYHDVIQLLGAYAASGAQEVTLNDPALWERTVHGAYGYADTDHRIYDRYLHYAQSDEARGAIADRLGLIYGYGAYRPIVNELRRQIGAGGDVREHPAYVNGGDDFHVFQVAQGGQAVAVLLPRRTYPHSLEDTERRVEGGLRVRGQHGFHQLLGVSYETGAAVAEYVPGRKLAELSPDELERLEPASIQSLIDVACRAYLLGFRDLVEHNFVLTPEGAFMYVDLSMPKNGWPEDEASPDAAMDTLIYNLRAMSSGIRSGSASALALRLFLDRFWQQCVATFGGEQNLTGAKRRLLSLYHNR